MSDIRDDETTPDRQGPPRDGGTSTEPTTAQMPPAGGDLLGVGGMPDPDAPSRRPRPKIVSLLAEFLKMSRTTAILLGMFVLVGALYSIAKEEPVVAVRTPHPPVATETGTPAPTEPTATPTEPATGTTVPTATPQTSPPVTGTTTPQGQQVPTPAPGGTGQAPQQQAPQQPVPQGQQPQGQAQQGQDPGDAGAGGGQDPVTAG